MHRHLVLLALLGIGCCSRVAFAETTNCTNITSLPAVLSSQGVYCLKQDLSAVISSGNAITIANNNVTLDCNDFKIGGLAAGPATTATGISATNRLNITVRNCNVRGFRVGLSLTGTDAGYNLVENSRFDLNTVYGVQVSGDGSTIRNVRVYDTGNATAAYNAYGISASGAVDILDNAVNNVTPSPGQYAYGILSQNAAGREISRNRVSSLLPSGTGRKFGIFATNPHGAALRMNTVSNLYVNNPNDIGIGCEDESAIARDNVVTGYAATAKPIDGCQLYANAVN